MSAPPLAVEIGLPSTGFRLQILISSWFTDRTRLEADRYDQSKWEIYCEHKYLQPAILLTARRCFRLSRSDHRLLWRSEQEEIRNGFG